MIGLEAADCIAREGEHLTEFELQSFASSFSNAPTAGHNNTVSLFDHAINGEKNTED